MDCGIPFCNNGCPVNNIIPDWNDLVYRGNWKEAIEVLHSTNNFPDFTGRICPAPCEAACTLNINTDAVGIKSIEHAIIDKAWANGWVVPQPSATKTGKKVAIVGSGPAGLAAAQQLARVGHDVTVFEKSSRIGGLLGFGIPDFKLDKSVIDRRVEQMQAEGVTFRTQVLIGDKNLPAGINNDATETISADQLKADFDAVILAAGSEVPRDLPVPGRELKGIHAALEFLIPQNKEVQQGIANPINVKGKHVVVIGGGDTGSDCVGTSNRHGAASVTQFELMPMPPEQENKALTWPNWPYKLRTSSSHDEGCTRDFAVATKGFVGDGKGNVKALKAVRLEWKDGKMVEVPAPSSSCPATASWRWASPTRWARCWKPSASTRTPATTPRPPPTAKAATHQRRQGVAAGDVRRGQSLVVWAIREGRQAAREVDAFLMGARLR
jgi:glutamate synthase (NADPH/NADH) small chain